MSGISDFTAMDSPSLSADPHDDMPPPPLQALSLPNARRIAVSESSQPGSRSSSAASGQSSLKRKRAEAGMDDDVGSATTSRPGSKRPSFTSDFSQGTKDRVRSVSGDRCWHCCAPNVEICHVLGSRDKKFENAQHDGRLGDDIKSRRDITNSIALCANCHKSFDHPQEPGFFFFPSNLEYFLVHERADRKRRRELARKDPVGAALRRICPTAESYRKHESDRLGVADADATYGMYTRLVLQDFLPAFPGRHFQPGSSEFGEQKPWAGSPMAALNRAWPLLGRGNLAGVSMTIRQQLRMLQDLYNEPLELRNTVEADTDIHAEGEDISQAGSEGDGPPEDACGAMKGKERESEPQKTALTTEQTSLPKAKDADSAVTDTNQCPHTTTLQKKWGVKLLWQWGPYASSCDAMKFFQKVLQV